MILRLGTKPWWKKHTESDAVGCWLVSPLGCWEYSLQSSARVLIRRYAASRCRTAGGGDWPCGRSGRAGVAVCSSTLEGFNELLSSPILDTCWIARDRYRALSVAGFRSTRPVRWFVSGCWFVWLICWERKLLFLWLADSSQYDRANRVTIGSL